MKFLRLTVLLMIGFLSTAQAQYTTQGQIEFEKKINLHRQLDAYMDARDDEGSSSWLQALKSKLPRFYSSFFNLYFKGDESVYKPGRETENPMKGWGNAPASDNIVYTHFQKQQVVAKKNVFEGTYLLKDSTRKMRWKILEEVRTIAGYKCRKAVGKMFDSVVVVAFYTDDIMVTGGPEMFSGLPGMIMEIAIPRLFTTWVATKVELVQPKPEELTAPTSGKEMKPEDLQAAITKSMKNWGKSGERNIWWIML